MQPEIEINVHPMSESGMAALLHSRGMHIIDVAGPIAARAFTPVMGLAAEVLRQAFADLESNIRLTRAGAQAWIERDDDSPFSLVDVADKLGLDAANIRQAATDPDRRRAINERLRREWREGRTKA